MASFDDSCGCNAISPLDDIASNGTTPRNVIDEKSLITQHLQFSSSETCTLNIQDFNYIHNEHTYAYLYNNYNYESKDGELQPMNHISIDTFGIVDKIVMNGFPMGQYTLSINGHNSATSKYNIVDKCNEFDFTSHKSNMFEAMSECCREDNEPVIEHRENYLNFSRCDSIKIHCPKNIIIPQSCEIILRGFFPRELPHNNKNSDNYQYGFHKQTYRPHDTFKCVLNHPTHSIKIFAKTGTEIVITINGVMLSKHIAVNGNVMVYFVNPLNVYSGVQNEMLSKRINDNTVNMSRIDNIRIIAPNNDTIRVHQCFYVICNYLDGIRKYVA